MAGTVKGAEKRRSERLLLSIPIHVFGKDGQGKDFFENTSTVIVGRYGALIRMQREPVPESIVKIVNPRFERSAEFRVVMRRGSLEEEQSFWGVECLDASKDIWGIHFPAPLDPDDPSAGALLRCDQCQSFVFTKLAGVAADLIDVPGAVQRYCDTCQTVTPWTFSEYHPKDEADIREGRTVPAKPQSIPATGVKPRATRATRMAIKLRLRIRDSHGRVEFARAENISKTGLCFMSERDYPKEAMLMMVMGYSEGAENVESLARVVRVQPLPDSPRKVYGVKFER